jgi:hypothetical protein
MCLIEDGMQYTTHQFYPVTSRENNAMAQALLNIIQSYSNNGWSYLRTECFEQVVPSGCCLISTQTVQRTYVAVFYKQ